jgi:hypothetical protein
MKTIILKTEKPPGIFAIGGLLMFCGVYSLFLAVISFLPLQSGYFFIRNSVPPPWNAIIGLGFIVWGWNILKLQEWARKLLVIILGLYLAVMLVYACTVPREALPEILAEFIACVLIFLYLNQSRIRKLFSRHHMDITKIQNGMGDVSLAHKYCFNNRESIEKSTVCGCFYCLSFFVPKNIRKWTQANAKKADDTALCPHCQADAVIGNFDVPLLSRAFLVRMNKYWFENAKT